MQHFWSCISIFAVLFHALFIPPECNCYDEPSKIIHEGKKYGFNLEIDYVINKPLFIWNRRYKKQRNIDSNEMWKPSIENNKQCGSSTCSGRSTEKLRVAPADKRLREACYCDRRCSDYQDCCHDSPYRDVEKERNPLPYVRVEAPPYSLFIPNSQYVRFIHTCPSTYKNVEIIDKCANASNFHNGKLEDAEFITLVTSSRTEMTYANKYCAECNNEIHWKPWTLQIKCPVESTQEVGFLKYINSKNLKFDNDKSKWYFVREGISYYCNTNIKPAVQMKYDFARISACPASWNDAIVRQKCENGAYYKLSTVVFGDYLRYHNFYFKNKYCALCNGISELTLTCRDFGAGPPRLTLASYGDGSMVFLYIFVSRFSKQSSVHDLTKSNRRCLLSVSEVPLEENWFFTTYVFVALLISLFFLICNLIVSSLTEELKKVKGKIMASFCSSLILAYGSFIAGNFLTNQWGIVPCEITAVVMYYAFLSVFSNMLCVLYDLRKKTLYALKFQTRLHTKHFFFKYSVCSWGTPVIPVSISIALNHISPNYSVAPKFGGQTCWFQHDDSLCIFFVLPVSAICVVNFILFVDIFCKMRDSERKSSKQIRSTVDSSKVYLRIAVLTGFTWIIGLVANYTQYMFWCILFVLLNTSHGLFVFIAFSCKKRVLLKLLKRFGLFESWQAALRKSMMKQNCNIELEVVNKKSKLPQLTSPGRKG